MVVNFIDKRTGLGNEKCIVLSSTTF